MQRNIAVISLTNIRKNTKKIRALIGNGVKLFSVVKANAYGHGLIPVGQAVEPLCDGLIVTDVSEGIALRTAGIFKDILVLTPPLDIEDVYFAAMHGLIVTVCNFSSYRLAEEGAIQFGVTVRAHLKINTGMNRLGLCGIPLEKLCKRAKEGGHVRIEGAYSHLYAPQNERETTLQRERFLRERETVKRYFPDSLFHLAASGGILRGREYFFDGVRAGILLYGYTPSGFINDGYRPAMKVYTHAMQTHRFTGGGVGYAKAEKKYGNLTAYSVGYADGFLREGNNFSTVGNLCMDASIRQGKAVYGRKKLLFADAEKVAKQAGTIPYEVLCAATRRAYFEYR